MAVLEMTDAKTYINYTAAAFLLLALLSPGCSRNDNTQRNKITYWSSNNTDEITFAEMIVDQWNSGQSGPVVHVQPVPEGQSSEEVILAAAVGNTTPDIYSNMWQGDVEFYARSGRLVPLDTIPGFLQFIYERCDSAVVKEITSDDGHIYQVPWKINPIMIIYNENIFKVAGYSTPPLTYDGFFKAAQRMKDRNIWIGYSEVIVTWWQRLFDFYPFYLAASDGGKLVDGNRVVFNNEYAVRTFGFLKTLYDNGYMPRERISAQQDPFLSGVIATRFTGPWEIVHAEKFKPDGFEYSYAPLPVPGISRTNNTEQEITYTYGDTKNIVIFNTCRNVNAAWNFIKLMLSRKNELLLLKTTAQLPRRKDLETDPEFIEFFRNNPKMQPFARQARFVRGPDNCPVLKEIFDIISQEYEACVIYGRKTPRQAVKDAADAAQLLLK